MQAEEGTENSEASLLSRRRADTRRDIHQAALNLFEARGVKAVTVQDIAEAAGISRRTFFRYYSSKEHAAIQGQQRLLAAVESIDLGAAEPSEVLTAIEGAAGEVITSKHDPTLTDHRRVARILAREESLRSFAAQQENELVAALSARLEQVHPQWDPLTARLVAELAMLGWRTCWQRWGELDLQGRSVEPAELYQACRATVRHIVPRTNAGQPPNDAGEPQH